ncbi:MAG: hypothetical protein ACI9CD_001023 [Candidatus Deianiraeaceae bacterium]|jgi:hypothetical protein
MSNNVRSAELSDLQGIKALYQDISEKYPDSLSPFQTEITDDFIYDGLSSALERGAAMIMTDVNDDIIAYFKGYTSKNIRKAHVLDNMTIVIRSDYMSTMAAYRFCKEMFVFTEQNMPHIKYGKCMPHAVNSRSLRLLQSLNMNKISCEKGVIFCANGSFVDEVVLMWENKNFTYKSLMMYHKYLLKDKQLIS